jgi:hypothetical protein
VKTSNLTSLGHVTTPLCRSRAAFTLEEFGAQVQQRFPLIVWSDEGNMYVSVDSRCPAKDSNRGHPQYRPTALATSMLSVYRTLSKAIRPCEQRIITLLGYSGPCMQ